MNSEFVSVLAYIDPGVGSIILQVVVAGLLSAGVMFRRYLVAPFSAWFRKSGSTDDASHEKPT